jgi:Flp pilus assembly pilin Flp
MSLSLTTLSHRFQGTLIMKRTLNALLNDENGFVVSAELVLVLTVGVLAMVVGLHAVSKSITMEMNDIANAFGALDQSYSYKGLSKDCHANVVGSGFHDHADDCDCTIITQNKPKIKYDNSGSMHEAD